MGVIAFATRKPIIGSNLYTIGRNNDGELMQGDNGDVNNRSSPVQVGASGTWEDIAGGQFHAAMTKSDGTLWTAGNDIYGQLGHDTQFVGCSSPTQVGSLTDWSLVTCSWSSTFAIKTDGTMWSWGYNVVGELGLGTNGTPQNQSSPNQIGALTTWRAIDAGQAHVMAIKDDNTLWSWGNNIDGCLGILFTSNRSSPVQVGGTLNTWNQVSAGGAHTLGIKTDGTLWSWGQNGQGQLGIGNTLTRTSPVAVGSDTDWAFVEAGEYLSIAIKNDGTLWTWGSNSYGQHGDGGTSNSSSPIQVGALTDWSTASAWRHVLAVKTDGTFWAWGDNLYGKSDHGDEVLRSSPVQVGAATDWDSVAAGAFFSLALRG